MISVKTLSCLPRALCVCIAAAAFSCIAQAEAPSSQRPVALEKSQEQGEGLEALPGWPAALIVEPISSHRIVSWYKGPELTSVIYEVSGGQIRLTNLPYDEHARVLAGKAILTSADGQMHVFGAGSTFVVPQGWNGTWKFAEGYRGEMTFKSDSLARAMTELFGK